MYREVMRRAGERGARRSDFGRSKIDTGSFAPAPLHYRYKLLPGATIPENNPPIRNAG